MRNFIALLFSVAFISAQACSCWGPQNFCEASSVSFFSDNYILMGKKIKTIEHGMEVEIIHTYREEFFNETIKVWGDLGWLCREYTGQFINGDTIILDLQKIGKNPFSPLEDPHDFALSFCGLHYLHVFDGRVHGHINNSEEEQSMSFSAFKELMTSDDCVSEQIIEEPEFVAEIYPNPFIEQTFITTEDTIHTVIIYDVTGSLIHKENNIANTKYTINTAEIDLVYGLYFVKLVGDRQLEKVIRIIKS